MLFIGFAILLGVAYFAMYMDYFKMEFQSQRDLLVWTAPAVREWMMYDLVKDHLQSYEGKTAEKPIRQTLVKDWSALLLFELDEKVDVSNMPDLYYGNPNITSKPGYIDYGLLDKEFLLNIQTIEDNITNNPKWHHICFADEVKKDDDWNNVEKGDLKCSLKMSL